MRRKNQKEIWKNEKGMKKKEENMRKYTKAKKGIKYKVKSKRMTKK